MQVHASFYHINYQYHMRYVKRIAKLQITYLIKQHHFFF
jgi:hypothetical protein